eukprot:Hpha_TRINITY_DN14858_c0_g1::TRINITY_DN14858_c0_g1_i4::g.170009::m.170009
MKKVSRSLRLLLWLVALYVGVYAVFILNYRSSKAPRGSGASGRRQSHGDEEDDGSVSHARRTHRTVRHTPPPPPHKPKRSPPDHHTPLPVISTHDHDDVPPPTPPPPPPRTRVHKPPDKHESHDDAPKSSPPPARTLHEPPGKRASRTAHTGTGHEVAVSHEETSGPSAARVHTAEPRAVEAKEDAGSGEASESGSDADGEEQHGGEDPNDDKESEGSVVDPVGQGNSAAGFTRWKPPLRESDGRLTAGGLVYELSLRPLRQIRIDYEVRPDYDDPDWTKGKCSSENKAPHVKHGRTKGCSPTVNLTELCADRGGLPMLQMYQRKSKITTYVPGRVLDKPRLMYRGHWGPYIKFRNRTTMVSAIKNQTNAAYFDIPGSEMPASINALPIADSHDGEHNMFQRWPVERQVGEKVEGRVERA